MTQTRPEGTPSLCGMLSHGAQPAPAACLAHLPWHPWLVVAVCCMGAFIGQLDASIVQLALPRLASVFGASLEAVSWVALAYLLAFAAFLPIFGRLCEMFGRKLLYLIGYLLFTVATVLCGTAPSLEWLLACRALQGVGGAMLGANSIAILAAATGPDRRARAMGWFAAAQAVGISAGPIVGGVLLDTLDWRWVFWAAVPFGLAAAALGWLALPRTAGPVPDRRFDGWGALLLMPTLTLLVLALNQIAVWGPASPPFLLCLGAAGALLAAVIRRERRASSPLVDLRLFATPGFVHGAIAAFLGYALLYGMFFLMSFALVRGYHEAATVAGLRLAVIPVAIGLVAPFSGIPSERWGPGRLAATGMALCIVALLGLSFVADDPTTGGSLGMAMLALFGAGLGLFIAPSNHAALAAAPATLSGEAGAMLNLMRVLGTSLGVASVSAMLSWRMPIRDDAPQAGWLFEGRSVVDAVESSLAMLILFAGAAVIVSLLGARSTGQRVQLPGTSA